MTEALSAPARERGTARIPAWSFADRIRKIRRDVVGTDQAAFARDLGVTKQAYSAWESGRNEPRAILALAKKVELISGVPAAWLLGVEIHQAATGSDISRCAPVSPTSPARLTLVPALPVDYPPIAGRYPNSPQRHAVQTAANGVNHAYTA